MAIQFKDLDNKLTEYEDFVGLSFEDLKKTVKKLKENKRRKSVKITGKSWSLDMLEDFQRKTKAIQADIRKIENAENITRKELELVVANIRRGEMQVQRAKRVLWGRGPVELSRTEPAPDACC